MLELTTQARTRPQVHRRLGAMPDQHSQRIVRERRRHRRMHGPRDDARFSRENRRGSLSQQLKRPLVCDLNAGHQAPHKADPITSPKDRADQHRSPA
jgi:hypothetical protein